MSEKQQRQSEIFLSLVAQHDNLGDLIIRKAVADYVADSAADLHVLTVGVPASFIDAFRFANDVRLHSGKGSFMLAFTRAVLAGRATVLLSPGPQHVAPGPRGYASLIAALVRALIVRASGGRTIAIGRSALSVRKKSHLALERWTVAQMTHYVARDRVTRDRLESDKVVVAPDVAFSRFTGTTSTTERPFVSLSFRNDREVEESALRNAIRGIVDLGFEPLFVSQVRRDDEQHAQLAVRHGCKAILWGARTHTEQLERVQSAYRESIAAVSDRLHVLIVASCEGAHPIAIGPQDSKAVVTLSDILPDMDVSEDGSDLDILLGGLVAGRPSDARDQRLIAAKLAIDVAASDALSADNEALRR